ncbi:MAG: DUF3459 domain-containing protein [Anaerolineae bacterium]|nr:DUF3459 domain-containing protein [Anaerolineae bacterium]
MKKWIGLMAVGLMMAGCWSPAPTATVVSVDTAAAPTPGWEQPPAAWWDSAVFYEIFVRSFYDSDGDGIGDLQGIIQKLDYLNDGDPETTDDLGVTGLWLMPIMPSPSYHGYDVTDYRDINPDYGTQEDFHQLMEAAHARGVRVIVDMVLNHTSSKHPWFLDSTQGTDSARRDWYIWSDTDPGYAGPWGQQVWHASGGDYYYGIFWSGMPDLNLENPEVTAELHAATHFWLEEMGVDGFRLDAARHYVEDGKVQENTAATHDWLRDYYTLVHGTNPEALLVGEIWSESEVVTTYLGDQLDLAFEFSLASSLLGSVLAARATDLANTMAEIEDLYPWNQYAPFLTNHDQDRVMSELARNPERARLAATVLLTLPGTPFIYYGEEIGMTGSKPDELIRTPMQWSAEAHAGFTAGTPWEPVNDGYEEWNVAVQAADPGSLLNHYRTLIHLRQAHDDLSTGDLVAVDTGSDRVYAYLRGHSVLVVVNFDARPVAEYAVAWTGGPLPPGQYEAVDLLTGEALAPVEVDAAGTVAGYVPAAELAERGALVIGLRPDTVGD